MSIVSLSEMKTELGLSDTTDDTALTQLIVALDGRFDSHCNRKFARAADTEHFDGGGYSLYLRRFPVESVASVHVSADQDWIAANLLAADDYIVIEERGRLVYGYGTVPWTAGVKNIRVVYTGGYVAGGTLPEACQSAMPEAVRRAFLMQCSFEWRNRRNLGAASVGAQGANINLAPAALLPEVKAALVPFIRF